MTRKLRVGVLYGGRSVEHEVSCRSARFILSSLDPERWEAVPIAIDKEGRWLPQDALPALALGGKVLAIEKSRPEWVLLPRPAQQNFARVDVVFPVLHGTFGEDGTIQGLLDLAEIPYVGAGTLGSALGMAKEPCKRLALQAGIPIVPYMAVWAAGWGRDPALVLKRTAAEIGFPCFVKPANLGSSVGVSKVKSLGDLGAACQEAFHYDEQILIEKAIPAREIELAVLGDGSRPEVSLPGEIVPRREFYSYDAKYLDDDGAELHVPARLSPEQTEAARSLAVRAFQALEGYGMARVDLFLDRETGAFYFNEINTLPGFTEISMYPKLWASSGVPAWALVTRLLELALERHTRRSELKRAR